MFGTLITWGIYILIIVVIVGVIWKELPVGLRAWFIDKFSRK